MKYKMLMILSLSTSVMSGIAFANESPEAKKICEELKPFVLKEYRQYTGIKLTSSTDRKGYTKGKSVPFACTYDLSKVENRRRMGQDIMIGVNSDGTWFRWP